MRPAFMIDNLRIALRKQKKLIDRRAAVFLETEITSRFEETGIRLQNLARQPSFSERDYSRMQSLLENDLSSIGLVEEIFLVYQEEDPLFPLLQPLTSRPSPSAAASPEENLRGVLAQAEAFEFRQKEFESAAALYEQVYSDSKDRNVKAQMLYNIGRCFTKLNHPRRALESYKSLSEEYPDSVSSSGRSLELMARIQIIRGYQDSGENRRALYTSMALYRDVLRRHWAVNGAQFQTYSRMIGDIIDDALATSADDVSSEESGEQYSRLKALHQDRRGRWRAVAEFTEDIVPDLRRRLRQLEPSQVRSIRHSQSVDGRDYLVLAATIPDMNGRDVQGVLGVKIDDDALFDQVLRPAIENLPIAGKPRITVANLSGDRLWGSDRRSSELATVTVFFDANFPPWSIEFFRGGDDSPDLGGLRANFYFWTILTLILILTFGAVLLSRAISQEMEILKIKSHFVSSVSHEFKTPLTSIKALVERLQDGKVKDDARMNQYFSVIAQDTDKLTKLVTNLLDFSRIEEGKKEYEFVKTDVGPLVVELVEDFQRHETQNDLDIHIQVQEDLPPLDVDREAFCQALQNLLGNAVKFSPGKKDVSVRVGAEGQGVIIEVEDQGIGIPSDEIDKIFERFYQGRSSLLGKVKGTGLGLTLVKHIVDSHGGQVTVRSSVGQGSTFSLVLPATEGGE